MICVVLQAESPSSGMGEENEVIMAILRGIYEKRQLQHTHIGQVMDIRLNAVLLCKVTLCSSMIQAYSLSHKFLGHLTPCRQLPLSPFNVEKKKFASSHRKDQIT